MAGCRFDCMNFMASLISEQLKEQQDGIAQAVTHPLWQRAAAFAADAHAPELPYQDLPYQEVPPSFAQSTRVALIIAGVYHCQEPSVLAAALLHNLLEKTDVTFDDLSDRFGHLIALRVQRLTRDPEVDDDVHFRRIHACDWQTRLVKLADAAERLEDETEPLEDRIAKAEPLLDLAFGDEHPVQRAQRHLSSLLENARVEASVMSHFASRPSANHPVLFPQAGANDPYMAG